MQSRSEENRQIIEDIRHGEYKKLVLFADENPQMLSQPIDNDGNSLLHLAILYNKPDLAEFLCRRQGVEVFELKNAAGQDVFALFTQLKDAASDHSEWNKIGSVLYAARKELSLDAQKKIVSPRKSRMLLLRQAIKLGRSEGDLRVGAVRMELVNLETKIFDEKDKFDIEQAMQALNKIYQEHTRTIRSKNKELLEKVGTILAQVITIYVSRLRAQGDLPAAKQDIDGFCDRHKKLLSLLDEENSGLLAGEQERINALNETFKEPVRYFKYCEAVNIAKTLVERKGEVEADDLIRSALTQMTRAERLELIRWARTTEDRQNILKYLSMEEKMKALHVMQGGESSRRSSFTPERRRSSAPAILLDENLEAPATDQKTEPSEEHSKSARGPSKPKFPQ